MRLHQKHFFVILLTAVLTFCFTTVPSAQSFSNEENVVMGILFSDYFDDNRNDDDKWKALCGEGIWEEKNQRLELQVFETTCPVPAAIGVESMPLQALVTEDVPVILDFYLVTDVGSTSSNGYPCFELRYGANWIRIQYEMSGPGGGSASFNNLPDFDRTREIHISDSNGNFTVMPHQYSGAFWNKLELYENRYKVTIGQDESGWININVVGSADYATLMFYVRADGIDPLLYARCAFDSVVVSGVEAWEEQVYKYTFDNPEDVLNFRAFRDGSLGRTARGKYYQDELYKNSNEALNVLVENPDLMLQARRLIEVHKHAVEAVLDGREGVISNTEEIISFLDACAVKSPQALKDLLYTVKGEMLGKKMQGEPFLGFELR